MRIFGCTRIPDSSHLCSVMRMPMQRQAQCQQQLHAQQYAQQHKAGSPCGHQRQMEKRGGHEEENSEQVRQAAAHGMTSEGPQHMQQGCKY